MVPKVMFFVAVVVLFRMLHNGHALCDGTMRGKTTKSAENLEQVHSGGTIFWAGRRTGQAIYRSASDKRSSAPRTARGTRRGALSAPHFIFF